MSNQQQPMSAELIGFLADVSKALAGVPKPAEFGGGVFYVSDVQVRWSDGSLSEVHGHFRPNDFEGYDFVLDYVPDPS